ncbi:hypothetical protein PTKIN_Ptkin06aG0055100 [Pterospermum kingtungense]
MNTSLETTSSSSQSEVEAKSQKRKAGRKKFKETRHPVYKGVRRRNGKWVCELREPKKKSRIWLGTFSTPDMAARAYDAAALALKGVSASLNFPELAYTLPRPRSSSIRDIQCAAMEAAEAFVDAYKTPSLSSSLSSSSPLQLPWFENSGNGEGSSKMFMDEEEVFNMPEILESLAEGLMLTPPSMQERYYWDGGVDDYVELTDLWGE